MIQEKEIIRTVITYKNDIKYITHFVNRPVQQGDEMGGAKGISISGKEKITEVVSYIFRNKEVNPTKELLQSRIAHAKSLGIKFWTDLGAIDAFEGSEYYLYTPFIVDDTQFLLELDKLIWKIEDKIDQKNHRLITKLFVELIKD